MPINLLRQIASSRLPITFYRPDDVDEVRVLCSAGMVIALVPSAPAPAPAQVLAVTQKGLEDLDDFSYPTAAKAPARPWLGDRIAGLVSSLGEPERKRPPGAGKR